MNEMLVTCCLHPFVDVQIGKTLHDIVPFSLSLDNLFVVEQDPRTIVFPNSRYVVTGMNRRSFMRDECLESVVSGQDSGTSYGLRSRGRSNGRRCFLAIIVRMREEPLYSAFGVAVL